MKKIFIFLTILFFSFSLNIERENKKKAGVYTAPANRWYIVDGDTVRHQGVRFRIKGVDTPELPTTEGEAAKKMTERFFAQSKNVSCRVQGTDTYGRFLSVCVNDQGVDLAQYLLNNASACVVNWCNELLQMCGDSYTSTLDGVECKSSREHRERREFSLYE